MTLLLLSTGSQNLSTGSLVKEQSRLVLNLKLLAEGQQQIRNKSKCLLICGVLFSDYFVTGIGTGMCFAVFRELGVRLFDYIPCSLVQFLKYWSEYTLSV